MPITIKTEGIPQAQAALRALTDIPRDVLEEMALVAFAAMKGGAQRHTGGGVFTTGKLLQSLFHERAPLKHTVGHDLDTARHAEWVIFGARPHRIVPKRPGGLLRFQLVFGGPFIFAKAVNHPGYAGDNYRDAAANDALAQFARIVDTAFKEK
jgi:hypothetical protein